MVNYMYVFASGDKKRHLLNIRINNDYLTLGYFFVCLGLLPNLRICHSYGDVTISGNGRLILTYTHGYRVVRIL